MATGKPRSISVRLFALSGLVLFAALNSPHLHAQQRGQSARPSAAAEPRTALVIGNGSYAEAPLNNPVNDARDMAFALKQVGFDVIPGENLTRADMLRAIEDFGNRLKRGGVGLFYFAGHGMQVKGENYLIPVQAKIQKELDVEVEAVQLARVLNEIDAAKNRLNVVILDACRNNPFARSFRSGSRGLGSVEAPTGTLIAYATSPGNTASDGIGRNGLYTEGLLSAMRTPGLKIEDVFKLVRTQVRQKSGGNQIPWESSSVEGDFYFIPANGAAPAPTPATLPPVARREDQEQPANNFTPNESGRWVVVADESVRVEANAGWVDTGIQVKAGQEISIRAGGVPLNLGAIGYVGAGGNAKADARKPIGNCPTGALIAKLNNEIICIKSEYKFRAASDGALWLGVNESNLADNAGAWVTSVLVQEFRRQ
jgi:hypothetical protein